MRIAILSCFYPYRGGISQFNANIYHELRKDNIVRAFNFSRQYPDFLFPGKTQYVSKDDSAVPVESTVLLDTANPFSYIKTAKEIRNWNPDIVLMRYWMSWFGPSLGYVARKLKKDCKVIQILDNVTPHEPRFFDKPFTKYFLSGGDGYITLCSSVAEDLLKYAPDAKYRIIPHPLYNHFGPKIDRLEAERSLGLTPGKKNILFFGLIRDYKGLDILIDAFDKLDDSYQLIIAGEPYGPFDKYSDKIRSNRNKDRIKCFLEFVKDSDVSSYFSAADVVVLPYRSATQSGVSSVAYHFDLPMIVTHTGGLKEAIEGHGTGLVAEKADSDLIRCEIERFFADSGLRTRCIENIGKEKERLSWQRFCSNMLEFAQTL